MPLVACLLGLAALAAQDPAGCRRCDHRGVQDCPRHEAELLELERGVGFCAAAARCADCGGALLVPCARCEGGPETAAMTARRAEVAAWLAREDPLEKFCARPLVRIETPHFAFVEDVASLRRGKQEIDGHLFLHLLARDAEHAAALIGQHYSPGPKDYRARMRLWFWGDGEDHERIMRNFLHSGSSGDFKMLGHQPLFSVWTHDRTFLGDEPTLRSLGVHNGVHMLLSNLYAEVWIGDQQAGWLDSGSAHWYEEKIFGRVQHYCIDEVTIPPDWNGGRWRAALRELLERKSTGTLLPDLLKLQTGEMTPEQQALCWSIYDWIVATRPDALAGLLRGAKQRQPAREMFSALLELPLLEAEPAWRAWVGENYPRQEPKPRRGRAPLQ